MIRPVFTARPKATVTIHPASPVFIGETVTLTCDIGSGHHWQYDWVKDSKPLSEARWRNEYTISKVAESHRGDYTCKGRRSTDSRYSETSDAVTLTVSDLPKPTLTVEPERPVFSGESVTLKCEIKGYDGWTYQWYKQDPWSRWTAVSHSEYHTVNGDTLTIRRDTVNHGDQYWCRGERHDRSTSSQYSDPVTLTVKTLPTAELTVEPKRSPVFSGESVTLKCEIKGYDGWTYQWYKQDPWSRWTAVSQSVHHTVNGDTLTIRGDTVINGDQYLCRGERHDRPTSSEYSSSVTLTVKDLPKPTLTVEPERPVFSGESVTLKCEIKGYYGWTYQWYKLDKQSGLTAVSQSEYHTVNGDTLTIRRDTVNHGDQYWCRGERHDRSTSSQYSDPVTLTVKTLPTAELTVEPKWSPVFSGESVTLTCEIKGHDGWTYRWYKHDKQSGLTAVSQYHTVNRDTLTIRGDTVINGDQYLCRGERHDRPTSSEYSSSVTLTVKERPKPAVSIQPDHQVFRGETVTLRCDIQGGGVSNWQYSWFKAGSSTAVSNKQHYSISSVTASDGGTYTCIGAVRGTSRYSHTSEAVTLTVSAEKPKPELTSSHKGAAPIGNPVVLYCKLDQSAGWRFYWSKHTQSPENETKPETHSYTISSVSVSDGGQYWCRAGRGTPVYYTHYSDALWINVTGTTRSDSLTVSPSRAQHFSADSLSLSCEGQSDSTGWRVRRYTHSEKVSNCSSDLGSVTGSTCNISSLSTSHTGVYWCESESGESSNPVNITVTNGAVILDSPVHPVTEGDPLTLRCLYRDPKPSNLTAEFYKNGSLLQTQTTGEMTIRTVSKSDEGLYHCKHPERGESPQSWISVRGDRVHRITNFLYII
uniref:Ig-like domain-containing protein n=1 Tax=Pygocentrus nattereri TaxID=42514 RepID=A0AAR2LCD7_PYGNA